MAGAQELVQILIDEPQLVEDITRHLTVPARRRAAEAVVAALRERGVPIEVADLLDRSGRIPLELARQLITADSHKTTLASGIELAMLRGWHNQGSTTIPCPMLATLFQIGALDSTDGLVSLEALERALQSIVKVDRGLIDMFMSGTRDAEFVRVSALPAEQQRALGYPVPPASKDDITVIDLFSLVEGRLDHTQDLAVLTDKGFNREAFEAAKEFATLEGDDDTFSLYELAKMQEVAGDNDSDQESFWKFGLDPRKGAARGNIASLFEMALLLQIFGQEEENGDLTLSVAAFESLYIDHQIPAGFTGPAGSTRVADVFKLVGKMWWIQARSFVKRGVGDAVGRKPPADADFFELLGRRRCPFIASSGEH